MPAHNDKKLKKNNYQNNLHMHGILESKAVLLVYSCDDKLLPRLQQSIYIYNEYSPPHRYNAYALLFKANAYIGLKRIKIPFPLTYLWYTLYYNIRITSFKSRSVTKIYWRTKSIYTCKVLTWIQHKSKCPLTALKSHVAPM